MSERALDPFAIELAQPADFESLKILLDGANALSAELSGERQWENSKRAYEQLQAQIQNSELFIIRDSEGLPCAAMALDETDSLWGEEGSDDNAVYVHKLMKNPNTAPSGVRLLLLGFAAQEATRRGKTLVRCDTKLSQPRLINDYHSLGFNDRHQTVYSDGKPAILLEARADQLLQAIEIMTPLPH